MRPHPRSTLMTGLWVEFRDLAELKAQCMSDQLQEVVSRHLQLRQSATPFDPTGTGYRGLLRLRTSLLRLRNCHRIFLKSCET